VATRRRYPTVGRDELPLLPGLEIKCRTSPQGVNLGLVTNLTLATPAARQRRRRDPR
jgi:hypothetical protein